MERKEDDGDQKASDQENLSRKGTKAGHEEANTGVEQLRVDQEHQFELEKKKMLAEFEERKTSFKQQLQKDLERYKREAIEKHQQEMAEYEVQLSEDAEKKERAVHTLKETTEQIEKEATKQLNAARVRLEELVEAKYRNVADEWEGLIRQIEEESAQRFQSMRKALDERETNLMTEHRAALDKLESALANERKEMSRDSKGAAETTVFSENLKSLGLRKDCSESLTEECLIGSEATTRAERNASADTSNAVTQQVDSSSKDETQIADESEIKDRQQDSTRETTISLDTENQEMLQHCASRVIQYFGTQLEEALSELQQKTSLATCAHFSDQPEFAHTRKEASLKTTVAHRAPQDNAQSSLPLNASAEFNRAVDQTSIQHIFSQYLSKQKQLIKDKWCLLTKVPLLSLQ